MPLAAETWSCRSPGRPWRASADGVMVDVHPNPETALRDGAQALADDALADLADAVTTIPVLVGRMGASHLAG